MEPDKPRADSRTADFGHRSPWLRASADGVLIFVRVQPGARRCSVVGEHGERLKIAVQAPPVEGRANDALIDWLAGQLGVARQQLRITAGRNARDKTLRAEGVSVDHALRRLGQEQKRADPGSAP